MADKNKATIKEMVQEAREKVEPQIKKAKEKAQPYIEKMEPTIEKAKKKAQPYIDKMEPTIEKAKSKAQPVVREAVGKAAKAATKTEVFLQFGDHEKRIDDVIEKVREDYLSDGKNVRDLKKLRIYIKPEDHAAYYVANANETGRVSL